MSEPIRVLIVDDHRLVRDGLVAFLREDPDIACVGEAADGAEALRLDRQLRPDLVLMDIGLADLDGIETTRRLLAERPDARVLMLSMYKERDHVTRSLEAGACGYVHKDVGGPELLRILKVVHQGGRYLGDGVPLPGAAAPRRAERPGPGLDALSKREQEVLALIAAGHTNKAVARRLGISVRTVEAHRLHIRGVLNIDSTAGLTRFAIAHGLGVVREPDPG